MRVRAIFLVILCALFVAGDLHAEVNKKRRKKKKRKGKVVAFKQGQMGIQAAGGLLVQTNYSKSDYSIYGENEIKKGFPVNFRFEYGATDFLGIGLWYGMYSDQVTITDITVPDNIYGYKHKYTQLCLRPAFHVPLGMAKFDPYVAVPFGLNKVKATPFSNEGSFNYVQEPLKNGFGWGIHAGANLYFSDHVGAFIEAGYGQWLPIINFGLAAKF